MMQAPAQSSQLLPGPFVFSRLCSALTLAGLAFYACAPELIAPELAPLPAQRRLRAVGSAIRHGHCHMHSVTNHRFQPQPYCAPIALAYVPLALRPVAELP